MMIWYRWAIIY